MSKQYAVPEERRRIISIYTGRTHRTTKLSRSLRDKTHVNDDVRRSQYTYWWYGMDATMDGVADP